MNIPEKPTEEQLTEAAKKLTEYFPNGIRLTGECRRPQQIMTEWFWDEDLQKPMRRAIGDEGPQWIIAAALPAFVCPEGYEVVAEVRNTEYETSWNAKYAGLELWTDHGDGNTWKKFHRTLPDALIIRDNGAYRIAFVKKIEKPTDQEINDYDNLKFKEDFPNGAKLSGEFRGPEAYEWFWFPNERRPYCDWVPSETKRWILIAKDPAIPEFVCPEGFEFVAKHTNEEFKESWNTTYAGLDIWVYRPWEHKDGWNRFCHQLPGPIIGKSPLHHLIFVKKIEKPSDELINSEINTRAPTFRENFPHGATCGEYRKPIGDVAFGKREWFVENPKTGDCFHNAASWNRKRKYWILVAKPAPVKQRTPWTKDQWTKVAQLVLLPDGEYVGIRRIVDNEISFHSHGFFKFSDPYLMDCKLADGTPCCNS